jgi:hypothetical protein
MSQFDTLRNHAIARLDPTLGAVVQRINVPAFLALLTNGATQNRPHWEGLLNAIIQRARQEEAVITPGITEQAIVSIVWSLFVERQRPKTLGIRGDIVNAIINAAVREAASRQGLPVSPELQATMLTSLGTGSFFQFPGPFAVLTRLQDPREMLGEELLQQLATTIAPQISGLDAGKIARTLTALLVEPRRGNSEGINDEVLTELLRFAANEAAGQLGVPIEVEDARAALRLLLTGEFFRDVIDFSSIVLRTVPRLPVAVVGDIPRLPATLLGLLRGIVLDTVRFPQDVRSSIESILNGTDVPDAILLRNTLGRFYDVATLREIATLLRALFAPENETARLALILYARANGVPITQQHLDVLRDSVLNVENPDLAPILEAGVGFLRERYQDQLLGRLQGLVLG